MKTLGGILLASAGIAVAGCGLTQVKTVTTPASVTQAAQTQSKPHAKGHANATGAVSTMSTTTAPVPSTTVSTPPASPQCNVGDCAAEAAKGGTLVECADGMYSNAGGFSGACSDHGGEMTNASASPSAAPTTSSTPSTYGTQYTDGQVCGTAGNGNTETYRAAAHQCYWGDGVFAPMDQNPNDASASQCPGMEIGPESDCYVAAQLARDYESGGGMAWTDTVTEGNNTIHFQCYDIGTDLNGGANPAILDCNSTTDVRDWVEWEFT